MSKKSRNAARRRKKQNNKKESNNVIIPFLAKKKEKEKVQVYVVSHRSSFDTHVYRKWIREDPLMELCDKPIDADVLVFTGGQDINPALYGQPKHSLTSFNSDRDNYEVAMFAMGLDKLKVGICRGAQLLNALSGGSMIQHVQGHKKPHALKLIHEKGAIMEGVPSTHHQMMLPSPHRETRSILATAYRNGSLTLTSPVEKEVPGKMLREKWKFFQKYQTDDFNPFSMDAEIIYYNSTNSLCIQSHPEKFQCPLPFRAYCNNLITTLAIRNVERLAS